VARIRLKIVMSARPTSSKERPGARKPIPITGPSDGAIMDLAGENIMKRAITSTINHPSEIRLIGNFFASENAGVVPANSRYDAKPSQEEKKKANWTIFEPPLSRIVLRAGACANMY
jgi:hypothetical protein